jgi:small nuclear ribonucleoprotein E
MAPPPKVKRIMTQPIVSGSSTVAHRPALCSLACAAALGCTLLPCARQLCCHDCSAWLSCGRMHQNCKAAMVSIAWQMHPDIVCHLSSTARLIAPVQNLIFRFLQSRQKVQIWLYEQADLRIEGRIIVRRLLHSPSAAAPAVYVICAAAVSCQIQAPSAENSTCATLASYAAVVTPKLTDFAMPVCRVLTST